MPNPFDQFDEAPKQAAANPFDQFDDMAEPAPQAPVNANPAQQFFTPSQGERDTQSQIDAFDILNTPLMKNMGGFAGGYVNGVTLGNADNLNAAVDSAIGPAVGERQSFSDNKADQRELRQMTRENAPVASMAGEITGFLSPGGLAGKAMTKAGATVPQAANQGLAYAQRLGGLALLGGAENALFQGTVGASNREAEQGRDISLSERGGMAVDGGTDPYALAAGPAMSAMYRGGRGLLTGNVTPPNISASSRAAPSIDELEDAKRAAYKEVDNAGVQYSQQGYMDLVSGMEQRLKAKNFDAMTHPKAARMLDRLVDQVGEAPTLSTLDNWRKTIARDVPPNADPAEKMFASMMRDEIDTFIAKGDEAITGVGREGGEKIAKARELNTTFKKAEMVEDAVRDAELRAASTGSGGNFENTLRQNFRKILADPRQSNSFTPDELKLLEQAVRGTTKQNIARLIGKLSPEGNGLMAMMGVGGTVSNPLFAAVPAAGFAAKRFSQSGAQRNADALSEAVRGNPQIMQQLLQSGQLPPQAGNALAQMSPYAAAGTAGTYQNALAAMDDER